MGVLFNWRLVVWLGNGLLRLLRLASGLSPSEEMHEAVRVIFGFGGVFLFSCSGVEWFCLLLLSWTPSSTQECK
jgi:hypothetical protein